MITVRRKFLLKLFGWGWYQQRKRESFPSSVSANHRLWWMWWKQQFDYRKQLREARALLKLQDKELSQVRKANEILRSKIQNKDASVTEAVQELLSVV